MAATAAGTALTEAHQASQLALKAQLTGTALTLWPLLDPDDLDRTLELWLAATVAHIERAHDQSQQIARSYFTSFAHAETGTFYDPPPAVPIDVDRLRANLTITGPVQVKSLLTRGHPLDQALKTAQVRASGEAARLAMQGHRRMLADALNADFGANPPPVGYARVTSAKPCAFCAMLASRGPVYRSEGSGGFRAHGHCACTVEPVFRRDAAWPGRAREFHDLWNQAQREARAAGELRRGTGNDALNAFRRALNADGT